MYIFSTDIVFPFRPASSSPQVLREVPLRRPSRSPRVERQFNTLKSERIFRTFVGDDINLDMLVAPIEALHASS